MLNKSENNTSPRTENNDATNEITTCGLNPQLSPGRNISIVIRPLPALIIAVMLAVGIIGSIICYNYVSLNVLVSGIFLCVAFFLFLCHEQKGLYKFASFQDHADRFLRGNNSAPDYGICVDFRDSPGTQRIKHPFQYRHLRGCRHSKQQLLRSHKRISHRFDFHNDYSPLDITSYDSISHKHSQNI